MTWVFIENERFYLHENETLLDGLIRTGHDVSFQCCEGYCGSCRLKVINNSHPINYERPPLAMIEDDEVLACCCSIKGSIRLKLPISKDDE